MMRRKRRRSIWAWADNGCFSVGGIGVVPRQDAIVNIFPSGITENRMRGRCVIKRVILWMNFRYVWNLGPGDPSQFPPDIDLYVIKRQRNREEGAETVTYRPFDSPITPSAIASWSDDDSGGGLDSYLWSAKIWGDDLMVQDQILAT